MPCPVNIEVYAELAAHLTILAAHRTRRTLHCVGLRWDTADVTHFVSLDSLIDLEARTRATTVYLADRRWVTTV